MAGVTRFNVSQVRRGISTIILVSNIINIWRVQLQKPLSDAWNFLLKLPFLSGSNIYVQIFYFNCIENDLYIDIRVKWLNLNIEAW